MTKLQRAMLLAFGLVLSSATARAAADDLDAMQGRWKGRLDTGADVDLEIKGSHVKQITSGRGGSIKHEYDITLDESTDPKSLDYGAAKSSIDDIKEPGDNVLKTKPMAIYKLDGDKLTICMDPFGTRPTKFASGKEGGICISYSRVKEKAREANDLARLQGEWTGSIGSGKDRQQVRLKIEEQLATLTTDDDDKPEVLAESDFTIDETARPRKIEFSPRKKGQSKVLKGKQLYLISEKGDSVELCQRTDGGWPKNLVPDGKQQVTRFARPNDDSDDDDKPAIPPAEKKPFKQRHSTVRKGPRPTGS